MNLQEQFNQYWKANYQLSTTNCQLLLAVSGGLDSVVLTNLVFNAGFTFSIAHCNFQLRGEESERDEAFVRTLAKKYDVTVHVKKFDTLKYAEDNKLGIQEAARELRYEWFEKLLDRRGKVEGGPSGENHQLSTIHYHLLTAHHADDNIETVLFNIFRGTGMNGLHGILPKQEKILRPLLFAKREAIMAYAKEKKLEWVEDSSNESTKYTRNYIRHEVLPMLKQIFPSVTDNISNSIERWREAGILYEQALLLHKKKLCTVKGNELHIPVLKLQQSIPLKTITFEIIKDFGFSAAQTLDVISLLQSESGKYVASSTHRVIRNRNWLIITPNKTQEADNILIEAGEKKIVFAEGEIMIDGPSSIVHGPSSDNNSATLDSSDIRFPLLLRKWKQGDYFYPLGMRKKKKVSRFLIDQKVSLNDKEKVWVVESNKKILWIVGHRIDDRFKITSSTKQVLQVSFKKN
jgi:tRNA(Ile)-lysidine synthase